MTQTGHWIGVDLGQTGPRAWVMDQDGRIVAPIALPNSVHLENLRVTLGDIGDLPVIVTGTPDIPTQPVPCKIPELERGMMFHTLPGIKQAKPADLMQGDETRIAGFLAQDPEFDGILCQPNTRTTWAHISAEEVVSFRSFLTGELLDTFGNGTGGFDEDAFQKGLDDIISRPADLSASLFSLRADALLNGTAAEVIRARQMALFIGAELSAARPYWLGQQVVILGQPDTCLTQAYLLALQAQGAMVRVADADLALMAGLFKGYCHLIQDT